MWVTDIPTRATNLAIRPLSETEQLVLVSHFPIPPTIIAERAVFPSCSPKPTGDQDPEPTSS